MGPLFADASYLIALADPEDQWHPLARLLAPYARKRGPLALHALAVGEVVAVIGPALGGKVARRTYEALRDSTEIHLPTQEDLDRSMDLVVRFDGTLSLSDALFLRLMERLGAGGILSFDRDFDGKGVRRISEPPHPGRAR